MIDVQSLGFRYANAARPVLRDVTLSIGAGEFVLMVGRSGSGKSTLLRTFNGLVPHFHGGDFSGRVLVGGRDTIDHQPRDLADTVGLVYQDPESQIVAQTVEDEIVFGMENLGQSTQSIQKRLEEALDQMHIAHLRQRQLDTLSGGELQRVAIASVLAMQPKALLLDEPTSQLDPQSADELLTTVQRLNEELGLTIVIAEHRLERVVQYADRVIYLPGDGSAVPMGVREAMATSPLAPPVSRVGRALGWSPLPLSVKEGRRFAQPAPAVSATPARNGHTNGSAAIRAKELTVRLGAAKVLDRVSFEAHKGEVLALMGRNGAGKTTLLRALVGLQGAKGGTMSIAGHDPAHTATEVIAKDVALVPQEPGAVLYHRTVAAEIRDTLEGTGRAGTVEEALAEWQLEDVAGTDPLDLSAGERQRTALAAMCAGAPGVLLLDEPTRGMDYETKAMLVRNLRARANTGATIIIASHDVELVASCADSVLLLAEGRVVLQAPVRAALTETLTFSTQINKLFGGTMLTPEDVLAGISER